MVGEPGELGCHDKVEGIDGYVLEREFVLECEEDEEGGKGEGGGGEMVKMGQKPTL